MEGEGGTEKDRPDYLLQYQKKNRKHWVLHRRSQEMLQAAKSQVIILAPGYEYEYMY